MYSLTIFLYMIYNLGLQNIQNFSPQKNLLKKKLFCSCIILSYRVDHWSSREKGSCVLREVYDREE